MLQQMGIEWLLLLLVVVVLLYFSNRKTAALILIYYVSFHCISNTDYMFFCLKTESRMNPKGNMCIRSEWYWSFFSSSQKLNIVSHELTIEHYSRTFSWEDFRVKDEKSLLMKFLLKSFVQSEIKLTKLSKQKQIDEDKR